MNSKLINGSRGTITKILIIYNAITCIFVRFDSQGINDSAIPITRSIISHGAVLGHLITVKQFPLRLSWAVTAHKSQGQTLKKVAISLKFKCFAHGSFYVTLSRVRKLVNILLFGDKFPKNGLKFHTNNEIN